MIHCCLGAFGSLIRIESIGEELNVYFRKINLIFDTLVTVFLLKGIYRIILNATKTDKMVTVQTFEGCVCVICLWYV